MCLNSVFRLSKIQKYVVQTSVYLSSFYVSYHRENVSNILAEILFNIVQKVDS